MESVPAVPRYDAGIAALSCVDEMKLVEIPCAPMAADEDAMKLVPVIAICVSTFETGSCVGDTDVVVGTGFGVAGVTVNVMLALVPPPGAGETMDNWCVPAATRVLAGIDALNCVAPMNVVVSGVPSHSACELGTRPVP